MLIWLTAILMFLCIAGAVFFGVRKKKGFMIAGIIAAMLMFMYLVFFIFIFSAVE